MERDRFFKADQAAEYGLIDRVISHALVAIAIGCSIAPRPSISSRTTSPGCRNRGRVDRLADAARACR